jgi:hypothetical protein
LTDRYLTFDRRTLGLTRLLLGFYLLLDLVHRGRWWDDFYSSEGVCPNRWSVAKAPVRGMFSLFHAFSTPAELRVLWALMFVTFAALLVGYRTKAAQIASLVLVTSMNARVLPAENGGYIVQNLLLLWTCFLPLGDRFSIDALVASMTRRREASAAELNERGVALSLTQRAPHVTVVAAIVLLQLAAIYTFNVVHKTGAAWRDGTAVHYVLYANNYTTPLAGALRDRVPPALILFLTWMTLAFEAAIPVALLAPIGGAWPRRFAVFMICALHIGFGATLTLGPFAWACCIFATLLFSAEDWNLAARTMRRPRRACTVIVDPRSGASLLFCRVLKRLDRFELLTFRERSEDRARPLDAGSLADIVAALPLGPIAALPLRAPILRGLVDAVLAALARSGLSRLFEVRASAVAEPPSRLRARLETGRAVARESLALVMLVAAVSQAMIELPLITRHVKITQPAALRLLTHEMRFFQGWFMWSPNPAMASGSIVVDALTVDGRHVDPFSLHVAPYTLRAPSFDLIHARSLGHGQMWGMFLERAHDAGNIELWEPMKAYLLALPRRTGHAEDALVSGDVYSVWAQAPRWGEQEPYGLEKEKLFSFEDPARAAAGSPP